ncbi:Signal_recognition particle 54 [Hexamita inflata]|uniref:signal-recognition-particle GTPase n=1 Tax=Hexamita inflata TaxID=28002 RepID=A0AA86NXE5_9EUKA|nr:Signal recognition particle 54 [Hexamita inflata]
MVLNELAEKLTKAMAKIIRTTKVDQKVVESLVNEITSALEEADVNQDILSGLRSKITKRIIDHGEDEHLQQYLTQVVCEEITSVLDPGIAPYVPNPRKPNVVAFYGLQGQGKTTTCAKYGAYFKKRGWRVGVVCCDTFRAGAFDQLKQNCNSVKLPFYGSYAEKDPVKLAKNGVEHFTKLGFNLIILDTSGRHRQSEDLLQEMKLIDSTVKPDDRIFVVDSSIGQAVFDQANAFKKAVNIGSIILTKMDGSTRSGGALAAVSACKAPIVFIGTGEKFDQFEPFHAESFVSKLMGFGDFRGMIDAAMTSGVDHKKNAQVLSKMMEGEFSFEDFKVQIEQINKMGPMDKIMEMIPGMQQIAKVYGFDDDKEGTVAIGRWLNMMNSMTRAEMKSSPTILMKDGYDRRVLRIARGSGYTVDRVKDFFKYAKQFSEQTKKFGQHQYGQNFKQMLNMQNQMGDGGQMNPQQMQQMQQMMKQMGGAGGMPNIPGLQPGADPHQAVAQLRQMGLLPEDQSQMKKMKKVMQGRK